MDWNERQMHLVRRQLSSYSSFIAYSTNERQISWSVARSTSYDKFVSFAGKRARLARQVFLLLPVLLPREPSTFFCPPWLVPFLQGKNETESFHWLYFPSSKRFARTINKENSSRPQNLTSRKKDIVWSTVKNSRINIVAILRPPLLWYINY